MSNEAGNDLLKTVEGLKGFNFIIPSYQRGYRWGENEVKRLLEDLWEAKGIYYLQLLEVVEKDGKYRVVDGQQRLTTIYLILQTISAPNFTIKYETKDSLTDYLSDSKDTNSEEFPSDKYCIDKARKCIREWFKEKDKNNFINILNKAKFFWYCLDKKEDEIKAFNRLNAGKTPLTSAELIKGQLFLHLSKDIPPMLLGLEWDNIEHILQDEDLWSFISKDTLLKNRISLLFEIFFYRKDNAAYVDAKKKAKGIWLFNLLEDKLKKEEDKEKYLQEFWKTIKSYSWQIQEWYKDKNFYHLIGYLMHIGFDIKQVFELYKKEEITNKTEFKKTLKDKIKNIFKEKKGKNKCDILDFQTILAANYNDNLELLRSILLLFNVILSDNEKYGFARFPFKFYNETAHENCWSLEHIHAQNQGKEIDNSKQSLEKRIKDLKYHAEQYVAVGGMEKECALNTQIKALSENSKEDEVETLEKEFFRKISFIEDEEKHKITNLALLSGADNLELSNYFFYEKLAKLKELDKDGSFIPIGTKNVFLKYYSTDSKSNIEWDSNDREDYRKVLKDTIKDYFTDKENKTNEQN